MATVVSITARSGGKLSDFVSSLIDGSRQQEQMAEARRLMAAGRPAKRRVR